MTTRLQCNLVLVLAFAGPAASASTCDAVRGLIDTKIKASGVARYTLTTVDADAKITSGKVVGTCDQGMKKIVYQRIESADPAANAEAASLPSAPPVRPSKEPILTECKDGTVSRGGDCKK